MKNEGGPWLIGLINTGAHNALVDIFGIGTKYTDNSYNTLVSRGGGEVISKKDNNESGSSGYTYNSTTDTVIDNSTGEVLDKTKNASIYNDFGYKNSTTFIENPYTSGFINKDNASLSISQKIDYYDARCHPIYNIKGTIKYGILNISHDLNTYYYKEKNNNKLYYRIAMPLTNGGSAYTLIDEILSTTSFQNRGSNNINDFVKKTNFKYANEVVYYCVNNENYYIKSKKGNSFISIGQKSNIENSLQEEQENKLYSGSFVKEDHIGSGTGFGRNHIYQNDPRIRNTRFGKSTIGDAGCGPVAAANLMGGALGYATDYAQKGGFVNNDGSTSINYFTSMFNGKNTTSKEEVKNRLKSNKPVVLLGKDESYGVYGSNNHFVTAKGYDRSGNIVVEDPDLPQSSMRYPANKVLKGMKAASIIGGKRRQDNRLVNYADDTTNTGSSSTGYSSGSTTVTTESTGNTISSIFSKLGNLASLIFKKTFGITWDDISGSTTNSTTTGNSGIFNYGSSLSDGGTESKSFTIKGNQRTRFVEVAKTQVGYREGSNNNTKYGAWYGANNNAWCVMFISWCAEKAGIPTSVIPKMASTTAMCNWFGENNRLHLRTSMYIPLPGDIVFFTGNGSKSGLKHTGMVESVNGTTLITIEGNYSDKVTRREYTNFFNNSNIYAFASPNFADDNRTITVEGYGSGSVYSVEDSNGNVVYDANDEKQKIWKFLRNKAGLSSIGASGLFGAWEAESGLKPKTVEGYYLSGFPGYDAIKTNAGMNDFTKNVLFPAYDYHKDKNGNLKPIKINKDAYKVGDNYYPGLGLAQWTGPRGKGLFDYARNNGYSSIWDTDAQLNYAKSEFDKKYPSLIGNLNNAATPEEAARVALDGYEMYNGFAAMYPDALVPRAKNARAYYEQYKGLGRNDREEIYNNPIAYGPDKVVSARIRDKGSYVSYDEYLETIVKILLTISDNTNAVNTILDIMNKEGANLSAKAREDISNAVKSSSSIQNLKDSLRNSMSGRSTGISSMIGNSRTDLIIKTMKEIASQ